MMFYIENYYIFKINSYSKIPTVEFQIRFCWKREEDEGISMERRRNRE